MDGYIKIYTKILENPNVGRLDDKTWRIMMELFLIAGDTFDDGKLPDVATLAWKLRRPEKEISTALQKLAKIGTVTLSHDNANDNADDNANDNTYDNAVITNFVRYQNTNQTAYDRVKKWRQSHKSVSTDNATDNAMITHDNGTDKDIDIDKELTVNANALTDARAEKSAQKRVYGSMKNVMLTDEEYSALKDRFADADEKIEAMSLYFGSHGNAKKYKNHYATALNWARMAAERDSKAPKKTQTVNEYPDMYTRLQAMQEAGQI